MTLSARLYLYCLAIIIVTNNVLIWGKLTGMHGTELSPWVMYAWTWFIIYKRVEHIKNFLLNLTAVIYLYFSVNHNIKILSTLLNLGIKVFF